VVFRSGDGFFFRSVVYQHDPFDNYHHVGHVDSYHH